MTRASGRRNSTRGPILVAVLLAHAGLMLLMLRNDPAVPAGIRAEFLLVRVPSAASRVPLALPLTFETARLPSAYLPLPTLPVNLSDEAAGSPGSVARLSPDHGVLAADRGVMAMDPGVMATDQGVMATDPGVMATDVAALDLPDLQRRCAGADPARMAKLDSPLPIALIVRVEADGHPSDVRATSRLFSADIGNAVRACLLSKGSFAPARVDGKPTASWVRVEWPANDGS